PALSPRKLGTFNTREIDVSKLGIKSTLDFQKVSYQQTVDGLHRLRDTVMPAVGEGHGREYFRDLDSKLGLSGDNGYSRLFDAYYTEGQGIKVDWSGNGWEVINGRHRLAAAIWEGFDEVPVFIRRPQ